jgi:AraC-like DNA-binding protein
MALRKGEEPAAQEALGRWLRGNPGPTALCPMRGLELVTELARVACEAGADPAAVAAVGVEVARCLLDRLPGGDVEEPLREGVRQWAALAHAGSPVSVGIRRAVAYLHVHYASPNLTRDAVAREAGLGRSLFSQAFRSEMGVTYGEYLRVLRVEEARRLLAGTSRSLKEIAGAVGYEAVSSLERAFKEEVGMAPGQYRKQGAGKAGGS